MSIRRRKIAERVERNPELLKAVMRRKSVLSKHIAYRARRFNELLQLI